VLVAMAIENPLTALVSNRVLNLTPVTLLNTTRALLESSTVYTYFCHKQYPQDTVCLIYQYSERVPHCFFTDCVSKVFTASALSIGL
jgi:hypothetical protein